MRITRDRIRLLGGVAVALAGVAMLVGIWPHMGAMLPFRQRIYIEPSGTTVVRIVTFGVLMLCGGIGVLFEFDSDTERKDPWEK
jgi:hypothetical protein